MNDLQQKLELLNKTYRVVPFTRASRLYSTVRRMQAEIELGIPVAFRTGAVLSVADQKPANELTEACWRALFEGLSAELKADYPDLFRSLFAADSTADEQ